MDKTTYHSLLVLLDYVDASNHYDKDSVVADALTRLDSWKYEVAKDYQDDDDE
jgi:hypothetical protein